MPAKSSREKKETTQPADDGDSKVPAKRSRRSQEKAQPADKDNSKVPAKSSRKSLEKAQPADEEDSKVPAKRSSRNQTRRAKNDALPVDEDDSELPVKRNRPERNLSGKRTIVANQNDVVSDEDKDLDKLKDDKHGMEKSNVEIEEDGQHGSDSIESGDDPLAIVEEDGKKKIDVRFKPK